MSSHEDQKSFVNVVRSRRKDGFPIVFLHAMSLDLTYWDAQFRDFSKTHRVVAFDWPGHGRSRDLNGMARFDALADVVASVIRDTGEGPAHLVGISMGSMIAQAAALKYSELVGSLTLIGSASTLPATSREAMRERAAVARREGVAAVLETATRHWFSSQYRSDRPDVIDRVEKTFLACDREQYATYWEMIAGLETSDQLSRIRCPTLVLVGADDSSTPPAAARRIVDEIPGATMHVIEGAAHLITIEAPEETNRFLRRFIQDPLA